MNTLSDSSPIPLGTEVPSEVAPGVVYRLVREVGSGGMSIAYYALRVAPEGESPVVLKLLQPRFVIRSGPTAALIVKKEAVALGRLNERVPPTPFVVRFIDTGVYKASVHGHELDLPWVVVEYVHGGAEGTTLTERVEYSLSTTGTAFDPDRAAHAVECLANGLAAVHDMGVVHRDVKPDNVLCCGFGDDEIFKIADFGVARPAGMASTFRGMVVGTLGFAAPELATLDHRAIGPWSDIFSLAAVIYFILTGEEYFSVDSPAASIIAACETRRKSIRDSIALNADLRANESACRCIDFALATATSAKIDTRPQRADALAAMIVPWLREGPRSLSVAARRKDRLRNDEELTQIAGWSWTTVRGFGPGRIVRSAAWDGDGRCMVATSSGLAFWNGSNWADVAVNAFDNPSTIRLVRRTGAGRWLVVGDEATLATYTSEGIGAVRRLDASSIRIELLSGDLDDLAVLVGTGKDAHPTLCALSGKRWLKPLPLPEISTLTGIAQVEDARWVLTGRDKDGRGFAAVYAPLDWEVAQLPRPDVRAFLTCAGEPDHNMGLIGGAEGVLIWVRDGVSFIEEVEGGLDMSAVSVDPLGRGWAASAGHIYVHRTLEPASQRALPLSKWECLYDEPGSQVPIISLFTDIGIVIAMTADGAIIEGRAEQWGSHEVVVRSS